MQNNRTNFWSRNNDFWKVPILHIIQNHWKNQLFYELFSLDLTAKYIQLYNLSLKLPMDSKCIEASSSKSISFLNVRGGFHIYDARQKATLKKMSKWCFVCQYEYGCLPLLIEI